MTVFRPLQRAAASARCGGIVRLALLACVTAAPVAAQGAKASNAASPPPRSTAPSNPLRDLSASVQHLAEHVSMSVVQVLVTGYGPVDDGSKGETGLVIARQRSIGSGAIIDADGYIVTNAHVVAGAQRVQVVLPDPVTDGRVGSLAADTGRTVDAKIIGTAQDIDLALLKVDAPGLRPIPLADYDKVRQGELVFAFGSPVGLRNSVTMGVVSAVLRQPDPDSPTVYIQTDAPINPGNSGGPLVNTEGELVGLNTFIVSESGGSQGLGFAIPSKMIAAAYPQLRQFGHLHPAAIGLDVQAITPTLAAGLRLSRTLGVIVSDVAADGPAAASGVQVQDILTTLDNKPIENVPALALEFYAHTAGDTVAIGLLRGTETLTVNVPFVERPRALERLKDVTDPERNAIPKLGVVGIDITEETSDMLPALRIRSGVYVVAREQESQLAVPLVTGDVIHAINGTVIASVDGLRQHLDGMKPNAEIVLQIERDGRLMFVTTQF